tara:strand:+ start:654 stop:893 length:240 start_codon:yes stop_codon:yes gene_type:complete
MTLEQAKERIQEAKEQAELIGDLIDKQAEDLKALDELSGEEFAMLYKFIIANRILGGHLTKLLSRVQGHILNRALESGE